MRYELRDDTPKRSLIAESGITNSGRPLAGRGQGQKQSVAKELRHYDARMHATFIAADS